MSYPKLVEQCIEQLNRLPGIGRRSAERIVFWILKNSPEDAQAFAQSIVRLKEGLMFCRICNNLSDHEVCRVCQDAGRDRETICVVEDHKHLLAIDRTGTYKGLYHVLLGALSPADGIGPEELRTDRLVERVRSEGIKEVIIATDPDSEGEMTALHLTEILRPTGVRLSRIGMGIPMGGSVEYADLSTLTMSLSHRRQMPE